MKWGGKGLFDNKGEVTCTNMTLDKYGKKNASGHYQGV
jgi:hypothetical protein